jgi:hypothetical protein
MGGRHADPLDKWTEAFVLALKSESIACRAEAIAWRVGTTSLKTRLKLAARFYPLLQPFPS